MREDGRLNVFINTHKYAITMTAIAIVSVMMVRHQSRIQWVNLSNQTKDDAFAFVTAG